MPPSGRRRGAFTLLELLALVGLVGAASFLLVNVRTGCGGRSPRLVARAQLAQLAAALSTYQADTRRFPRGAPRAPGPGRAGHRCLVGPADLLRDDAPALYAALRLAPARGGGPNAPYVAGHDVGRVTDPTRLEAAALGLDAEGAVAPLTAGEADGPPPAGELRVLLDPWGHAWHYREWASVRAIHKEALARAPLLRCGFRTAPGHEDDAPPVDEALDGPHDLERYDLWSDGPNGVDELGAGDDIASWAP